MAMGKETYVAGMDNGYYNGSGTSYATPVMAGMVTCLRQWNPYASVQEICDVIRQCGDHANKPDNCYGYGIPNIAQAMELLHVEEPAEPYSGQLISVFPNPSQGEVHVLLNQGAKASLTMYDFMGRQLYTYSFNGLNHTTLENYLNGLERGIYFINAVSDLGHQTVKFVIHKEEHLRLLCTQAEKP